MNRHVTVVAKDGTHLNVRGEVMFDPTEGTLTILSQRGSYMTFNWDNVDFFVVKRCEDCESDDHEDEEDE